MSYTATHACGHTEVFPGSFEGKGRSLLNCETCPPIDVLEHDLTVWLGHEALPDALYYRAARAISGLRLLHFRMFPTLGHCLAVGDSFMFSGSPIAAGWIWEIENIHEDRPFLGATLGRTIDAIAINGKRRTLTILDNDVYHRYQCTAP